MLTKVIIILVLPEKNVYIFICVKVSSNKKSVFSEWDEDTLLNQGISLYECETVMHFDWRFLK